MVEAYKKKSTNESHILHKYISPAAALGQTETVTHKGTGVSASSISCDLSLNIVRW